MAEPGEVGLTLAEMLSREEHHPRAVMYIMRWDAETLNAQLERVKTSSSHRAIDSVFNRLLTEHFRPFVAKITDPGVPVTLPRNLIQTVHAWSSPGYVHTFLPRFISWCKLLSREENDGQDTRTLRALLSIFVSPLDAFWNGNLLMLTLNQCLAERRCTNPEIYVALFNAATRYVHVLSHAARAGGVGDMFTLAACGLFLCAERTRQSVLEDQGVLMQYLPDNLYNAATIPPRAHAMRRANVISRDYAQECCDALYRGQLLFLANSRVEISPERYVKTQREAAGLGRPGMPRDLRATYERFRELSDRGEQRSGEASGRGAQREGEGG